MVRKSSIFHMNSQHKHFDRNALHNTLLLNLPFKEYESVSSLWVFMPLRTHEVPDRNKAPI